MTKFLAMHMIYTGMLWSASERLSAGDSAPSGDKAGDSAYDDDATARGREYGATALKKHVHIPQIRQDPELNSERHNKQANVPGGRPRTRSTMAHKWYTTRKYTDIYLTPRLGARNTNCAKH
jgi:hypothetical protein